MCVAVARQHLTLEVLLDECQRSEKNYEGKDSYCICIQIVIQYMTDFPEAV